jgi:two-component system NtrC family sensor kinase
MKKNDKSKKGIQNFPDIENGGLNTLEFVSHELKGILGSTIMCVYSIRDGFLGMLNFKQRASIETTIRNLRRLESTIKDFLDISRIEGGKLSIRKNLVNVNQDIIKEVEDTFLAEIYENKMILENRIPEDLTIKTDRNLLITVFNNLISNAIKYGESGGYIILNAELKENLVRFSVYNDGIVIKEDEKDNLFKKFSRLETEKNKKIKGTGLGLFIIKNIIDNLGGNIWLEAREKGNEFIFEIERD